MSDKIDKKEILKLKNVYHTYKQDSQKVKVLNNVSLEVLSGEMVALIGPSGTGKSTLLNIAGLLETPTSGTVELLSQDCTNINENMKTSIRGREVGFIFQSHRLFQEFSAIENVMLPQLIMGVTKKNAEDKSKDLLCALGLEKRLLFRPAKLSGGEAQRVAIARSLAACSASFLSLSAASLAFFFASGGNIFSTYNFPRASPIAPFKFAKALRFEVESVMRKFGPEGADYYSMVRFE